MARGFRVYDKLEKRMIDNPASGNIFLSGNGNLVNVDHPEIYLMDRYVRMDSTGKTDKNGKEIYEGNILRAEPIKGINDIPTIATVEWDDVNALFRMKFLHYPEHHLSQYMQIGKGMVSKYYGVIGDIYFNPELLK